METEIKKKPLAIIVYGTVAVGKLTVAKALEKELGYKLTHNHLINDLVWSIFDRGTYEANSLIERLRYELYEDAIRKGVSIIVTHAYSDTYISPTGLSDPEYMKTLEDKIEHAGGTAVFVHLQASPEALLERVQGESRKAFRKLTDLSIMKLRLEDKSLDVTTSAPVKDNLVIDNTDLSPESVVEIIKEYLGGVTSA